MISLHNCWMKRGPQQCLEAAQCQNIRQSRCWIQLSKDETLSTLKFAQSVKQVQTKAGCQLQYLCWLVPRLFNSVTLFLFFRKKMKHHKYAHIYIYSLCSPLVLGLLNSLPVYGPLSLAFDNILHPFQAVQNASWMKTWRFCLHSVGCGWCREANWSDSHESDLSNE